MVSTVTLEKQDYSITLGEEAFVELGGATWERRRGRASRARKWLLTECGLCSDLSSAVIQSHEDIKDNEYELGSDCLEWIVHLQGCTLNFFCKDTLSAKATSAQISFRFAAAASDHWPSSAP